MAALIACCSSGDRSCSPAPSAIDLAYMRVSVRPVMALIVTPLPLSSSIASENDMRPDISPNAS